MRLFRDLLFLHGHVASRTLARELAGLDNVPTEAADDVRGETPDAPADRADATPARPAPVTTALSLFR